jgi:hypothetical protein
MSTPRRLRHWLHGSTAMSSEARLRAGAGTDRRHPDERDEWSGAKASSPKNAPSTGSPRSWHSDCSSGVRNARSRRHRGARLPLSRACGSGGRHMSIGGCVWARRVAWLQGRLGFALATAARGAVGWAGADRWGGTGVERFAQPDPGVSTGGTCPGAREASAFRRGLG